MKPPGLTSWQPASSPAKAPQKGFGHSCCGHDCGKSLGLSEDRVIGSLSLSLPLHRHRISVWCSTSFLGYWMQGYMTNSQNESLQSSESEQDIRTCKGRVHRVCSLKHSSICKSRTRISPSHCLIWMSPDRLCQWDVGFQNDDRLTTNDPSPKLKKEKHINRNCFGVLYTVYIYYIYILQMSDCMGIHMCNTRPCTHIVYGWVCGLVKNGSFIITDSTRFHGLGWSFYI